MFEQYSFVATTTGDLIIARRFWVEILGFPVTEEDPGKFFKVDAGGLRLCVDAADGGAHMTAGSDPVIGLKVRSVRRVLETLAARGLVPERGPVSAGGVEYAEIRDPDGRMIILTERD